MLAHAVQMINVMKLSEKLVIHLRDTFRGIVQPPAIMEKHDVLALIFRYAKQQVFGGLWVYANMDPVILLVGDVLNNVHH